MHKIIINNTKFLAFFFKKSPASAVTKTFHSDTKNLQTKKNRLRQRWTKIKLRKE